MTRHKNLLVAITFCSSIKVAWHIPALVALEGLQAHPAKGRSRNVRACEKRGKFCNFAVNRVNVEASGF